MRGFDGVEFQRDRRKRNTRRHSDCKNIGQFARNVGLLDFHLCGKLLLDPAGSDSQKTGARRKRDRAFHFGAFIGRQCVSKPER